MIIHTVSPGETLAGIAQNYDTTEQILITANGITNAENLVVGQAIIIPQDTPPIGNIATTGYVYPHVDREVLEKTLPYLTYLSIFAYGLTVEGELIPIEDEEIIAAARQRGVAPIMMLTAMTEEGAFSGENAAVILRDLEVQDVLIDNIVETIQAKNYEGIDVDFEFLPADTRQQYIDFLGRLRARLEPLGKLVFVALAPKTRVDQPGLLYEAHDYAGLGGVADRALLMTYEWGYTYGPPLAVAPIKNVEQVINFALTQIPAEKLFMGIPNYGYDWTLPYVPGSRARNISNVQAVELAATHNATIIFDEDAQAPFFNYTDEEGNPHVVWFEDARSIDAKLRLANEKNLYGIGIWNLMRFFQQLWTVTDQLFDIDKVELS